MTDDWVRRKKTEMPTVASVSIRFFSTDNIVHDSDAMQLKKDVRQSNKRTKAPANA